MMLLNDDMKIHFTQAHLLEIQNLFQLIDEYGLPKADDSETLNGKAERTVRSESTHCIRRF